LQVNYEQLRHRIGSCIYCASVCDPAARDTIQATLQQCCNTEVATDPAQPLPGGFTLPRGSTAQTVLQHIEQLPMHSLQGKAIAGADARRSMGEPASEALITALRQCSLH
jgi:hypothetical protein